MIPLLMKAEKLVIPGYHKNKLFLNKGYDVIVNVSRGSNYLKDYITIMQTEIKCKEIPCYARTSACS